MRPGELGWKDWVWEKGMSNPNKKPNRSSKDYEIKWSPGTLLAIAVALLLVPLLITGFVSQ